MTVLSASPSASGGAGGESVSRAAAADLRRSEASEQERERREDRRDETRGRAGWAVRAAVRVPWVRLVPARRDPIA
eukprot:CAMPEP_0114152196 /NCGR_PEP_ID=MMETSP0043_2-20121206/23670_1 /TAXON_ID=464988 /ORGANISM="Hemiselmis andersenii, Strain CCMP644" /LENGTH=75 /DNA_ID=CAMNT_0001247103 /DNA_START=72 /DNA_END=295 /DNA_ORIENTATION=+